LFSSSAIKMLKKGGVLGHFSLPEVIHTPHFQIRVPRNARFHRTHSFGCQMFHVKHDVARHTLGEQAIH
jgi:hypothetical protein